MGNAQQPALEHAGVRFTQDMLVSMEQGRVMILIPRSEIRRVTLGYGSSALRPITQLVAGLVLATAALMTTAYLFWWVKHSAVLALGVAGLLVMAVIGLSTALGTFRRRYFLLVDATSGPRKLVFDADARIGDILEHVSSAEKLLGYRIERDPRLPT